jgi:hypothetical protein
MAKRITSKKKVVQLIHSLHPLHFPDGLISMGAKRDSGYLIPNDLEGIAFNSLKIFENYLNKYNS